MMVDPASDAVLLERFVACREEAAFAALVERYGPAVVRACRRVLRDEHAAEDVAQATFLILARKAATVPWRHSVGGWLCTVARRLALNARASAASRRRHETPLAAMGASGVGSGPDHGLDDRDPHADPLAEVAQRELRRVLGDELHRLPEKYRAPVVLCDLEGKTHEEAARQLGWPSGSMSRRLKRARALLRQRLTCRGVSLALGVMCAGLAALCAWNIATQPGPRLAAIRTAMRPLGPGPRVGTMPGTPELLARAMQGAALTRAERQQVAQLAQRAAHSAEEIRAIDPGRDRGQWQSLADEMRTSALALAQAADTPAAASAARRLNASCLNCHVAFGP